MPCTQKTGEIQKVKAIMSGQVALQALQFYSNNYGAKRQRAPKGLRFVVYIYMNAREKAAVLSFCAKLFLCYLCEK